MSDTDFHVKDAIITVVLRADSGYSGYSDIETARISADQWRRILEIIYEPEADE